MLNMLWKVLKVSPDIHDKVSELADAISNQLHLIDPPPSMPQALSHVTALTNKFG
jgi:hypothetical protein